MNLPANFLKSSKEWLQGFESGAAYILMSHHCPLIRGIYDSDSDEQLLLFAHNFGYDVNFKCLKDGTTAMEFVYNGGGNESPEEGFFWPTPS